MESTYVIISPVRNEVENIRRTLDSVIEQIVLPSRWIIVDDGSTDGTTEILTDYVREYSWIYIFDYTRTDSERKVGKNVVEILHYALSKVESVAWDFWVKLDGDIVLPSDYFKELLERCHCDDSLGIVSGQAYVPDNNGELSLEWSASHHVLGQARMYRRDCWEEIGSLAPRRLWDIIDVYVAQMHGWKTCGFEDLKVIHTRPIDSRQKGQLYRRFDSGVNHYTLGYHPLYFAVRCLRGVWDERPYILAALAMWVGYAVAFFRQQELYDEDLKDFIRAKQLQLLKLSNFIEYLRRSRI